MKNYEEKYKEDLEAAKGWLTMAKENNNTIAIQILEKLFPELKESEDERIRKEIISFITDRKNWFPKEETKSSWIAWLEKQANIPHFTFDDILALQCAMKTTEKADNELYEQLKSLHDRLHDVYWLEKQGEQKPVEERQYTRKIIDTTTNKVIGHQTNDGLFTLKTKPAWSEEDEKFYTSALWHIKNSCGNGGKDSGEYEVYNWLKSLKDRVQHQPKQKWSEEDERHRQWILECLVDGKRKVREYSDQFQSAFDWLKALKPRWKPLDEQMCAFRAVLDSYKMRVNDAVTNCAESLYNDLKSL